MDFIKIPLSTGPVYYLISSICNIATIDAETYRVSLISGKVLLLPKELLLVSTLMTAAEVLAEIIS